MKKWAPKNPGDRLAWLLAIMAHPNLSESALRVGTYLANCYNGETGQCNPGLERIEAATGLHRTTVKTARGRLKDHGFIDYDERGGRWKRATYELRMPAPVESEKGSPGATVSHEESKRVALALRKGSPSAQKGSSYDYSGVEPVSGTREVEPMSGKPDDAPPSLSLEAPSLGKQTESVSPAKPTTAKPKGPTFAEAETILEHLNRAAGKSFVARTKDGRPSPHIDAIRARLKEWSAQELHAVIDAKVAEWASDEKMCAYLRPDTLFRRSNCASYVGALGSGPAVNDPFRGAL